VDCQTRYTPFNQPFILNFGFYFTPRPAHKELVTFVANNEDNRHLLKVDNIIKIKINLIELQAFALLSAAKKAGNTPRLL
jgi:hypothetical protein